MGKEYHLRNSTLILGVGWIIGIILIYFGYLKQQPKVTDMAYFKEIVLAISLLAIILIVLFFHYRRTLYLGENEIGLPWPLKHQEKDEVKYENIEEMIIGKKNGKGYLKSFRDNEGDEYKISILTGKHIASEIKDDIFEKMEERDLDVEVNRE